MVVHFLIKKGVMLIFLTPGRLAERFVLPAFFEKISFKIELEAILKPPARLA